MLAGQQKLKENQTPSLKFYKLVFFLKHRFADIRSQPWLPLATQKRLRTDGDGDSMLAMPGMGMEDDDVDREYTVADLKERPKSYKLLSQLTGVPLDELKTMSKSAMRDLPVRHYNFDTSIFKPAIPAVAMPASTTSDRSLHTAASAANGWGMSDDDLGDGDDDDDDDEVEQSGASSSAGDPFAILTAQAAEKEKMWNNGQRGGGSTDALSQAFSSSAMASTPDVPVVVKPKPKPKPAAAPVPAPAPAPAPASVTGTKPKVSVKRTMSKAEIATRAVTTPPASARNAKDAATATNAATDPDSPKRGPNSVVAVVNEEFKKQVKAKEKRVRAMLHHELMKVQTKTKRLISAKKKLDHLVRSAKHLKLKQK